MFECVKVPAVECEERSCVPVSLIPGVKGGGCRSYRRKLYKNHAKFTRIIGEYK